MLDAAAQDKVVPVVKHDGTSFVNWLSVPVGCPRAPGSFEGGGLW